jgi:predicted nucleic acid-binding protein
MRHLEAEAARRAFAAFDAWIARAAERTLATSADITAAAAFLRRLDLPLRTPDALNIAIAQRVAAELLTFDQKLAASARALGTAVVAA